MDTNTKVITLKFEVTANTSENDLHEALCIAIYEQNYELLDNIAVIDIAVAE